MHSVVDNDLGYALLAVLRAYTKATESGFAGMPGGARGYQVLAVTVYESPPSQAALAQRLGVDRTVMTYLIDDLTAAGLVERQPDPADRRARHLVATAAGRTELRRVERALRRAEEEALAPLDEDEREIFRALLCRIARHALEHAR